MCSKSIQYEEKNLLKIVVDRSASDKMVGKFCYNLSMKNSRKNSYFRI